MGLLRGWSIDRKGAGVAGPGREAAPGAIAPVEMIPFSAVDVRNYYIPAGKTSQVEKVLVPPAPP